MRFRRLALAAALTVAGFSLAAPSTFADEFDPTKECEAGKGLHGICPGGNDGGQGRVEQETIDCLAAKTCGQPIDDNPATVQEPTPAPSMVSAPLPIRFTG
jgi:hypothetical protein